MNYDFSSFPALRKTVEQISQEYAGNGKDIQLLKNFSDEVMHAEIEPERIAYADVYTGQNAVLNYLKWFYLRYNAESGEKIFRGLEQLLFEELSEPTEKQDAMISQETLKEVLETVQSLFPYKETVAAEYPLEISLMEATCVDWDSGVFSSAYRGKDQSCDAICLYRLRRSSRKYMTPEHVLLRDLGELLMIRLYGHGNLPEEFRSFYRILLDYDSRFKNPDKEDIRGAFTEVFMLAVIDRAPKFAGPYAETPAKVTHQCYRYISSLFRGRALDEQERG